MTTYTENCSRTFEENSVRVTTTLKQLIVSWFENQLFKARLKAERRQLLEMSESMLSDIGIDPVEAETEARRNDIPSSRCHHLSQGNL